MSKEAKDRNGDPRFDVMDMEPMHVGSLIHDLGVMLSPIYEDEKGHHIIVSIVDGEAGIIAYAVGEFNAQRVRDALGSVEPNFEDDHRPELGLHQ